MPRRKKTVTRDKWGVSFESTPGKPEEGVTLHVYRADQGYRKGDHYGKVFPNIREAETFALERGYLEEFVSPWCRKCRVRHLSYINHQSRSRWCPIHKEFVT